VAVTGRLADVLPVRDVIPGRVARPVLADWRPKEGEPGVMFEAIQDLPDAGISTGMLYTTSHPGHRDLLVRYPDCFFEADLGGETTHAKTTFKPDQIVRAIDGISFTDDDGVPQTVPIGTRVRREGSRFSGRLSSLTQQDFGGRPHRQPGQAAAQSSPKPLTPLITRRETLALIPSLRPIL
jgi:hypothetical protein